MLALQQVTDTRQLSTENQFRTNKVEFRRIRTL
jgi:hypothetical protein